eukprot:scaffold21218_cov35-Prasinocladus_malaysianus.AAC.1
MCIHIHGSAKNAERWIIRDASSRCAVLDQPCWIIREAAYWSRWIITNASRRVDASTCPYYSDSVPARNHIILYGVESCYNITAAVNAANTPNGTPQLKRCWGSRQASLCSQASAHHALIISVLQWRTIATPTNVATMTNVQSAYHFCILRSTVTAKNFTRHVIF